MSNGLFITFEGTEGCGKSTQVARLVTRLRSLGAPVRELREPGGTPLGEEIRHTLKHSPAGVGMVPEAELLLFNAARAQLVRDVIRPALAHGEIVVCDRFLDSTLAYQGWGRGLDRRHVETVLDIAVGPTRPHLTLLLHVRPEVALARRVARAHQQGATLQAATDRIEAEAETFFARVESGFAALAQEDPIRIRLVDANDSVEAVEDRIWKEVEPRLPTAVQKAPADKARRDP